MDEEYISHEEIESVSKAVIEQHEESLERLGNAQDLG